MATNPDKQSPTETLDVQRRIEETLAGRQPIPDEYPYFSPEYDVRHLHIGTEKQLFLDNFILDHLENAAKES